MLSLSGLDRHVLNGDFLINVDNGFSVNTLPNNVLISPTSISKEFVGMQKFERVVIEIANAFLKRFDILSRLCKFPQSFQTHIVMACALLTNIYLHQYPIRSVEIISSKDKELMGHVQL